MKKQLMIFLLCVVNIVSAKDIIEVSGEELLQYWTQDVEKMNKAPTADIFRLLTVVNQRDGDYSYYSYDYVIDIDGYPKQFKFIGASPKEGLQDEKLLKRAILSYRYKPVTATPQKVKVHVINRKFGKTQAEKNIDKKDPKRQKTIKKLLKNRK